MYVYLSIVYPWKLMSFRRIDGRSRSSCSRWKRWRRGWVWILACLALKLLSAVSVLSLNS